MNAVTSVAEKPQRRWTGKSRGGTFGTLFFITIVRFFGPWPAYFALYFVAGYFVFTAPTARRASMQYLDRAIGPATGLVRWWRSYIHFLSFARTLVDRLVFGAHGASLFRYKEDGIEHILNTTGSGQGCIMISGHMGNWDLASGLLSAKIHCPFTVVAFQGDLENIRRWVEKNNVNFKPNIIPVGNNAELGALDIIRVLRVGHLVAVQADRTIDQKTVMIDFLGKPAAFPIGPYLIAALSQAPLITTFCYRVGALNYCLEAAAPKRYAFEKGIPRDEQLKTWTTDYVRHLEEVVRRNPYQWFNFFDFWG